MAGAPAPWSDWHLEPLSGTPTTPTLRRKAQRTSGMNDNPREAAPGCLPCERRRWTCPACSRRPTTPSGGSASPPPSAPCWWMAWRGTGPSSPDSMVRVSPSSVTARGYRWPCGYDRHDHVNWFFRLDSQENITEEASWCLPLFSFSYYTSPPGVLLSFPLSPALGVPFEGLSHKLDAVFCSVQPALIFFSSNGL